jgi:hypothetical protein
VTILPLQYLGCDVVGSATYRLSSFIRIRQFGCKAKVTYFDHFVAVQEKVAELEVAMDDQSTVEISHSFDDLLRIEARVCFRESLLTFQ